MSEKKRGLKQAKRERSAKKRRAVMRKRAILMTVEFLILFALLGTGYVIFKYRKLKVNPLDETEVSANEGVKSEEGYITAALFGGDSRDGGLGVGTNADTIIIATLDNKTKKVRLVSVYRDTLVQLEDGSYVKANDPYCEGGPEAAVNMLNRNLDLKIDHYVTVDFKALADTVDLLGGLEMDVTEDEAKEVNNYLLETALATDKAANPITAGHQTLDGVQTVTYARIRKNVGDDYGRTKRQRAVIEKLAVKAKQAGLSKVNEIINTIFPQIATSVTLKDAIKTAAGAINCEIADTGAYPFDFTDTARAKGLGDIITPVGVVENVTALHKFLYPDEKYTPSDTLRAISEAIAKETGVVSEDGREESKE